MTLADLIDGFLLRHAGRIITIGEWFLLGVFLPSWAAFVIYLEMFR